MYENLRKLDRTNLDTVARFYEDKVACDNSCKFCRHIQGGEDWFSSHFSCSFAAMYFHYFEIPNSADEPFFDLKDGITI